MPHKEAVSDCINCPIRSISIFAGFSIEDLQRLDIPVFTMRYDPGEIFYREQGAVSAAFTIRSGVVKLIRELPDGKSQILRLLTTGDIFGFEGLMDAHYHHTAVALTEVHACRLQLSDLSRVCHENPHVHEAILHRWAQALRQAESLVVELGTRKAPERLADFLENWCSQPGTDGWTPLPLTRQELAELLGLTVETVSRILADWKRRGCLEEEAGRIRLLGCLTSREADTN
ncbi:MAG: Crp/Fnr family transcriptional regulator [Gammaproteobacteria bacterium]|nr:MAG: Crp/Fnr family transcriptional regulator [Gammaproteobacteria bacterium]